MRSTSHSAQALGLAQMRGHRPSPDGKADSLSSSNMILTSFTSMLAQSRAIARV